MAKLAINLLQAELIAKQPLWTLKRVVAFWLFSFVITLCWWWVSYYQHQQSAVEFKLLNSQQLALKEKQRLLEIQIGKNKVDVKLQQQLNDLTLLLSNKKSLLKQLTDSSSTHSVGFSEAMTELAQLHHKEISLQQIGINKSEMTFSGLAGKPEAVPIWLAAFEQSTFLSGKSFNHFSLGENEAKVTTFVVSSTTEKTGQGE